MLKGVENFKRKDKKLILVKLKFSMKGYSELEQNEISVLSETIRDFFHFVKSLGENEKQKTTVGVWMLEDLIQKIETSTCGPFQIFFYSNSILPDANSKIQMYKKLTKEAVETLLNEPFTLDKEQNENIIRNYMDEKNLTLT